MQQIELSYAIAPRRSGRALIRNPLMELLHAVREHGSISAAARALGFSYRHVWGELKRWEQTLGHPLVTGDQGRSAQLSEFGDKRFVQPDLSWFATVVPCVCLRFRI